MYDPLYNPDDLTGPRKSKFWALRHSSRSVVGRWCRCGFVQAEQKAALDPRWIRLTGEDRARLDGTLAAHGSGQWRLREAQQVPGLTVHAEVTTPQRETTPLVLTPHSAGVFAATLPALQVSGQYGLVVTATASEDHVQGPSRGFPRAAHAKRRLPETTR